MSHLLIDPGMIPFESLKKGIEEFVEKGKISFILEKRRKDAWKPLSKSCNMLFYSDLEEVDNSVLSSENQEKYSSLCREIINDHRTLLIAERVSKIFAWNSVFNFIQRIEKIIYNSILLLEKNRPDVILFQATPHNLSNWVFARTAELIGIKVNMIQTSPLPWRFWIIEGIDTQRPVFPTDRVINTEEKEIFKDFIKTTTEDYETALPSYEKKRLENRGGKFWSWKKEIIDGMSNPKLLLTLFYKRRIFNSYNELTTRPDDSKSNLVYFLHYQPERTSMPEADFYSQQWLIIRMISISLPEGWELLVKEHPSTFTGKYDVRYRHPHIYKDIVKLKNVKLLSIEADTFNLIDKSEGVVTITGTVGVQALIRGRPVLVFGYGSFREIIDNVLIIKNLTELRSALRKIEDGNLGNIKENTRNLLEGVHEKSFSGFDKLIHDDIYSPKVRINGHVKLLLSFFTSLHGE